MIDVSELEKMPKLVTDGVLTKADAARKLYTQIYFNPAFFGLRKMDEDTKSDFLLWIYHKFEDVFESYHSSKGNFSFYLRGMLNVQQINWCRHASKKNAVECCSQQDIKNQFEEASSYYEDVYDVTAEPEETAPVQLKTKEHNLASVKKTALVLTLKNAYYVNDEMIDKLCALTGFNHESVSNSVLRLRKSLSKSADRRKIIIQRRDNAYYFHRRYREELLRVTPGSCLYQQLKKKYARSTASWKIQNQRLACAYRVCPADRLIGKELGLCGRQISFYMHRARRFSELYRALLRGEKSTGDAVPKNEN